MSGQAYSSENGDLISLYVHIPFCIKRCNYCDFNTYANQERFVSAYVDALCMEVVRLGEVCKEKVHTIYFGGGTPSVLPTKAYLKVLQELNRHFKLITDMEISMEVNPGTIQSGFLDEINEMGFNRLSIGMQSAVPEELNYLGRIHSPLDVIYTVKLSRLAGFRNISLDLMFGLPGQTISSWRDSINFALELKPTHLSLYSLTYEKGTRFHYWQQKGLFPDEPEDLSADLYEMAIAFLKKKDFIHYEISNWALAGGSGKDTNVCKHNMQYWLNQPYIGIGAGAHSCYNGFRWENIRTITGYIHAASQNDKNAFSFAQKKRIRLQPRAKMQETMLMGLRLLEHGVSNFEFKKRFRISISEAFPFEIEELIGLGLVKWKGGNKERLCLTERGCLVGNQVFLRFVD